MWCCLMRLNWDERKDGCTACRNAIWSNLPTVVLLTRLTWTQMCGHLILAPSSSSYHLLSTHILNRTIDWEFRFDDKETGTQVKRSICMSVGPADYWLSSIHLFSILLNCILLFLVLNTLRCAQPNPLVGVTYRMRIAHPPPPSIDTYLLIKFTHQQLYLQMVS